MSDVLASLVVSFGEGANSDALVMLELDPEMNEEKTSFAPGDEIFFRLHHDTSVRLSKKPVATHGHIDEQGAGNRVIEQQLLWTDHEDTHELSYIPFAGLSWGEYGNQVTDMRKSGSRTAIIEGGVMPALTLVQYSADFLLFRLISPLVELAEDESYPITIVAYMEAAA